MDGEAVAALLLGLACVAGIGVASSTLQSTVKTTPDDAIDFDTSGLPLGSGEVQEYKNRLQGNADDSSNGGQSSSAAKSASSGQATTASDSKRSGSASSGERRSGSASGGATDRKGSGTGPGTQSLLDKLLALLRALLSFLLSLLPLALGLAAVALAYARRDRLVAAWRDRFSGSDDGTGGTDRSVNHAAPTNEVARAWHEMVSLVGVDDRETKTPRECADRAIDRGVEPRAVEAVTRPFEEIRYGGAPVSDDRRDQANRGLQQVRTDLGDGR